MIVPMARIRAKGYPWFHLPYRIVACDLMAT